MTRTWVTDARLIEAKLPSGAYDEVYCSHNLEHNYRHDINRVLRGFLHVLDQTGLLRSASRTSAAVRSQTRVP